MNKKGIEMNLILIVKILAVLLVGSLALSNAIAFAKKDTIFKVNLAEDIRMMVDTLVGVPGDAVVEYPYDVSDYNVILSSKSVIVYKPGDEKKDWITRSFFIPIYYKTLGTLEEKARLCLEKREKYIFLKPCGEEFVEVKKEKISGEISAEIKDKFEEGFLDKVDEVSDYFGFDPNYLLAVMYWETGGTFDPCEKSPVSSATGLIQFMESTAKGLGTTTAELCQMSQVEQMDYVKKHFEGLRGKKARTLSDVYMVVLCPAAVGKAESAAIFTNDGSGSGYCDRSDDKFIAYKRNPLDANKDDKVTKQEAASKVQKSYEIIMGNN